MSHEKGWQKNKNLELISTHYEMLPWNARKLFAKKSMRWASMIWKQKNNQVLPIETLPHVLCHVTIRVLGEYLGLS